MNSNDLKVSEMIKMQVELYDKNKENWGEKSPDDAKNMMLYMIEEMGECISIIKKKGIDAILENKSIRDRFLEEITDVRKLLY